MLDLLLINPGGRKTIYQNLSHDLTAIEPPLWCRLIAGYCRDKGHSVKILDTEALCLSPDDVVSHIAREKPRLIGMIVYGHQPNASTQQMHSASDLCNILKLHHPDIPIAIAGGHVSALPDLTYEEEAVDYVIKGEGPKVFERLLSETNFPASGVLRDEALSDISELHGHTWSLLPMNRYRAHNWQCFDGSPRRPYASIYTSLGCPYRCLAGDTLVNTIYGDIPIRRLAQRCGDKGIPVYTHDPDTGQTFISDAINIRKYGEGEKLVRVHFDDESHIDCTPDHKFLQFKWGNGISDSKQWECEAQDLVSGAHVRAFKVECNPYSGYVSVSWGRRKKRQRSRLIMDYLMGRKLERTEYVHHKDHNKINDCPSNLEYCSSAKEHFKHHPEIAERMRVNNPTKNGMSQEWRDNIGASVRGKVRSAKSRKNYRLAALNRSEEHKKRLSESSLLRVERERGWRWYTSQDGKTYKAPTPRNKNDKLGRIGFNAHDVNHVVTRVEWLDEPGDVYCLTVPETGWFYANNVLVKNCSFCPINAPFGKPGYRTRLPYSVITEVNYLYHEYGVSTFKIIDEMFVLKPSHYMQICEGLSTLPFADELNIWAYARIDTVKPDTLKLLRRAGIRWLALGIESGSAHVRDGAEKSLDDNDIISIVKEIQKAGINVIGNFIFGLPDDTMLTMQSTLDLALYTECEFVNFYSAMPYPGSRLYDETDKDELPKTWSGYSQHSFDCKPLSTATLSAADVLRFRDEAFHEFYTDQSYLDRISTKFGNEVVAQIQLMAEHRLKRELTE